VLSSFRCEVVVVVVATILFFLERREYTIAEVCCYAAIQMLPLDYTRDHNNRGITTEELTSKRERVDFCGHDFQTSPLRC
jgi:hypothetical protein